MTAQAPSGVQRFVDAQQDVYPQVLAELRAGRKRGHWMWFVFPQIAGLGFSETSRFYAISGRGEAADYLAHPVLGPRLRECCTVLAGLSSSAEEVFGPVDAMKLRSSLTLFAAASTEPAFDALLRQYFSGQPDPATLARLDPGPQGGS